jgi:uncharacterized membrane protein
MLPTGRERVVPCVVVAAIAIKGMIKAHVQQPRLRYTLHVDPIRRLELELVAAILLVVILALLCWIRL